MSTISISKQLYPFFNTKASETDRDAAYAHAMTVYGASVASAMGMWHDNLHSAGKCLDEHPDGATRLDVCAITGILQECEICELWDVPQPAPPLFDGLARCFVCYDSGVYDGAAAAFNNGGLYARDPVGELDTFTTLAALQGYTVAADCVGNLNLAFGFVSADLEYVPASVLHDAVRASDDQFLAGLCKCAG